MSSRASRTIVAIGGTALVLLVARWLDGDVLASIVRDAERSFHPTRAAIALSMGYLMIAAGALLISALARRAPYAVVGLVLAGAGAFLTFLFPLVFYLTASGNAPARLTGPVADLLDNSYSTLAQGPLNAVAILGAVMLLVGLITVGSVVRHWQVTAAPDVADAARPLDVQPETPETAPTS